MGSLFSWCWMAPLPPHLYYIGDLDIMTQSPPLTGLRVLEFAGLAPGPFAGLLLADYGATVMPSVTGNGYATSASVWKEWVNSTGYTSDGFVFLAGMLNGAFAVGTPDITSHMAEEIPRPSS